MGEVGKVRYRGAWKGSTGVGVVCFLLGLLLLPCFLRLPCSLLLVCFLLFSAFFYGFAFFLCSALVSVLKTGHTTIYLYRRLHFTWWFSFLFLLITQCPGSRNFFSILNTVVYLFK